MTGPIRLDKLLANLGYGSRREAQTLARAGRVACDGIRLSEPDRKLTAAEAAALTVDGAPLDPLPGLVLVMNKPVGLTCSTKDAGSLVQDLLPPRWRRRDPPLSTVGRLDKATSGLLLLTDDGVLLHKIISPRAHVPKRYRAALARPIAADAAERFAAGTLMLEGETTPLLPARLDVIGPTEALVTVIEGRYHQVRRMFAALGNHVEALRREAIGGLELPADLAEGAFRPLTSNETEAVLNAGRFHTQLT